MQQSFFRPQLVEWLVIVIRVHVVKVYNNYASTLIIYKVNIFKDEKFPFYLLFIFHWKEKKKKDISNQTNLFVCIENSKSIH